MEHRVELVLVVGPRHAVDQAGQAVEHEAVHLVEARVGLPVAARVEVEQVAEQEPERVAHAPVRVGQAVEDLPRHPDVLGVVLGSDPQAEDLGAVLRQQIVETDHVAERLRHLAALTVDEEAVGQHAQVGRPAARRHRLEQ